MLFVGQLVMLAGFCGDSTGETCGLLDYKLNRGWPCEMFPAFVEHLEMAQTFS